MEVEGRKDDRLRRKREEESRKRGMVGEKRKDNNKETGIENIKKFETCLEFHRELEERNTESTFILGEGAMQLSSGCGFVENRYMDGTKFGETIDFTVAKAANCNELVE